jgi:very-short-patch-repair endonuclease
MGIIKKVIEKNMFFGAKPELFTLALQMRKNPTEAERAMWKILRMFRQSGFPFRRQHPIEFYIADFYKRISFHILNDLPPLTSGEGERGGEAGKSK